MICQNTLQNANNCFISLGEACPQTPINKHAQQKQQSGYIPFSILSKLFPPCLNLNLLQ